MCDPVSASLATAAVLKAGAQVAQGVQGYQTGKAQQKLYQQEGQAALGAANANASRLQREGEAFLGTTRAIQAASGVDIATGSPADVAAESAKNIEMDRLTELFAGRLKYNDAIFRGRAARAQGSAALTQGIVGGASTLLTSAADQGWLSSASSAGATGSRAASVVRSFG
jgi:hypothetical protein